MHLRPCNIVKFWLSLTTKNNFKIKKKTFIVDAYLLGIVHTLVLSLICLTES